MLTRTLPSLFLFGMAVCNTNFASAIGFRLSESKEELGLDYELDVVVHKSGRVTVNLAIADQGKLKPLDSVWLHIPGEDGRGFSDLSVALSTTEVDGKLRTRVHLRRDWAERAELHLKTWTPLDGNRQKPFRTWFYHPIPLVKFIRDPK